MILELAITAGYALAFAWLCREAVHQQTTVWRLAWKIWRDLALGLLPIFAAIGLIDRPTQPRVSQARIRQLERELGISPSASPFCPTCETRAREHRAAVHRATHREDT